MSRDAVERIEILLVEDNLEDANVTIQALKRGNVQCRVTLVCDGEEAMRFLRRDREFARAPKPDLILLDMFLPKKDGQHVLAEIRADVELMDIPVIVLTGSLVQRAILDALKYHAKAATVHFCHSQRYPAIQPFCVPHCNSQVIALTSSWDRMSGGVQT
jgi:CheY-like chemotaxis protein